MEAHYQPLFKKLPVTLKFTIKVKTKFKKYALTFYKWSTQHIIFILLDKKYNKSEKLLIMLQQEEQTIIGNNFGCLKQQM